MRTEPFEKRAYSVAEFLFAYGISRTFFYELVKAKALTTRKAGRKTLVDCGEAERWYRSLSQPAAVAQRSSHHEMSK